MLAIRKPLRALRGPIVLSLMLLTFGLVDARSASADTAYRFWHFNMCGQVTKSPCSGGEDETSSTYVADKLVYYKPVAASLNEVCESQYHKILAKINATSFKVQGRFTPTVYSGTTCKDRYGNADGNYGNALIVAAGNAILSDSGEIPLTNPLDVEPRKLRCLLVDMPRDTRVCNVHISPQTANQGPQIDQVKTKVNSYVTAGVPVVLMGDFNVLPDDDPTLEDDPDHGDPLDAVYDSSHGLGAYGRFQEIDEKYEDWGNGLCRCGGRTTDGGRKIDYIFVSSAHWWNPDGASVDSYLSDHHILRGTVTLLH